MEPREIGQNLPIWRKLWLCFLQLSNRFADFIFGRKQMESKNDIPSVLGSPSTCLVLVRVLDERSSRNTGVDWG